MAINIPSSSVTTIGTIEIPDELSVIHYQQFVMTTSSGTPIGTEDSPVPVSLVLGGSYVQSFNSENSVLPVGGVYYEEPIANSSIELLNTELSVLRTTVRGGLKTAGDGRVNELVPSFSDGYDDIYVSEDSFDQYTMAPITVSGSFFDTTRMGTRFIYVPMIRSGWRKLSFSIKSAAAGTLRIYADLGFLDDDLLLSSYELYAGTRYGFFPDAVVASGGIYSVPALASPVNGFIIAFTLDESEVGSFAMHLVRGA
jgi:hypothetical protein